MTHFFTTPTVAGSGDTIRFGSLESPIPSPTGMQVPPIFEPSHAFLFESLDFIADRLGVLYLREETRDPALVGETSSIDSGTHNFDGAASTLHSEQTLCSNPAVSNIHAILYLLHSIFHHHMAGSPTASCLPWTRTPGGSKRLWRHLLSCLSSWGWRATLPPISSTS